MTKAKEEAQERASKLIEKFGLQTALLVAEEFLLEYEVRDGMRIELSPYWLAIYRILDKKLDEDALQR